MSRSSHRVAASLSALAVFAASAMMLLAQEKKQPTRRAQLPTFSSSVTEKFFPDVFARVVGDRPANPNAAMAQGAAGGGPGGETARANKRGWSKIISPATIEDEVKAIKLETDKNITTPTDFAGRGYKLVRRDFTILAMLFAIIDEYDGDVRFKDQAPVARDMFTRTATNTKAGGNSNVYNEAKRRKDELQDLINGAKLAGEPENENTDWGVIANDRSPLMQRLETSGEKNLARWTSSKDAFNENIEGVLSEAEVVAAISEVLTIEGVDLADDEEYVKFARRMKTAALAVVEAVKQNNPEQASKAVSEINRACSDCHTDYR